MADASNINSAPFPVDLTGIRFGRLLVLSRSGSDKQRHSKWKCSCDCGAAHVVGRRELIRGTTRSCGCFKRESTSLRRRGPNYGKLSAPRMLRLGGLSAVHPDEYQCLRDAIKRCHRENAQAYANYGARGIAVCDRWRFGEDGKTGLQCFIEDMGPRPDGLTLDRIDNDGNYEPSNCRWATWLTQMGNTRRSRRAR